MPYLQNRHNKWRATVRIPKAFRDQYGGKEHLQETMGALDKPSAKAEADAWEAGLRLKWAAMSGSAASNVHTKRRIYEAYRNLGQSGELQAFGDADASPAEFGIELEIDKLAEKDRATGLTDHDEMQLAGLQDALADVRGKRPAARPELEPSFSESASSYLDFWAMQDGLGPGNTKQQKEATYRLFAGWFKDRPLREVRRADAATFLDALRALDPNWGRSRAAASLSWNELQKRFGNHHKGLSALTLNRHATTLQELWKWGEDRDRCGGKNPFTGLRQKIKPGKNTLSYLPWEMDELNALFDPPPRRSDVTELILVALHTGMRINEIASLTYGHLRTTDDIQYFQIEDAKTEAGNRQVPLHPALKWLADRSGHPQERLWPDFNCEGPGDKPGADAGKEFSNFKLAKGFADRRKVFHSFRKNVTQIMERASVAENEWAQVLGHERGFTYSRYSPHGITLEKKSELIALIDYPGVILPLPDNHQGK